MTFERVKRYDIAHTDEDGHRWTAGNVLRERRSSNRRCGSYLRMATYIPELSAAAVLYGGNIMVVGVQTPIRFFKRLPTHTRGAAP